MTDPVSAATKPCPFCGEQILPVAIKCKHCGSELAGGAGATAPAPVPVVPPTAAPSVSLSQPKKSSGSTAWAIALLGATCIVPFFTRVLCERSLAVSVGFIVVLLGLVATVAVGKIRGGTAPALARKVSEVFFRSPKSNAYFVLLLVFGTGVGLDKALEQSHVERAALADEAARKKNEVMQKENAEKQNEQGAEREKVEKAAMAARFAAMSASERFLAGLKMLSDDYRPAPEDRKQAVFNQARQFDAQILAALGNKLTDWEGEFDDLPDPNSATDILHFHVPKKGVFHVELRGVGPDGNFNGLPKTSRLFKAISKIGPRACASVSGTINPKEKSATDKGAMEEPEYDVVFESVKPCKAQLAAQDATRSRLGALPAAENLAAARTALADGYDVKKHTGGKLDDAERALTAIAEGAPEAAEAKKLLLEVGDRRDRAHLEAARAALAEGYDPKTGLGGNLDEADEHLKSISETSKVRAEAKTLMAELVVKKARATQHDGLAGFVKEASEGATFVINNGALVVTSDQGDSLDWKYVTIQAPSILRQLSKTVFSGAPTVQSISVVEYATVPDVQGNAKRAKIAEVTLSRAKAKAINLENVKMRNFPQLIDRAWQRPGLAFALDDE